MATDQESSEYGGDTVIACAIVFIVACTLFVSLRFVSHRIGRRPLRFEDWLMIPSWVLMMGLCANAILSVKQGGVGRHEKFVLKYMPEAMIRWTQSLLVTECIYGLIFPTTKTSILLLYLGLFRVHRWMRITVFIMIAYIWMWGISILLVAIFQCNPVASQWDKTITGTCINQLAFYRWLGVPNVIHDVSMLIVPAPAVWKLQMPRKQKIALTGIFLVGSIGCIASFIRVTLFFEIDAFSDNTWASIELMSWALAEPGIIIICACAPSIWPMVARYIVGTQSRRGDPSSGATNGSAGLTSSSNVIKSERRSRVGIWDGGHGHDIDSGGADFIRLDDIEEGQQAGYDSENTSGDRGAITVTHAFMWKSEIIEPSVQDAVAIEDDRPTSRLSLMPRHDRGGKI